MRPEVAGCYYDEEKKRYFPFLGRSKFSSFSSITKRSHDSKPVQESNYQKRTKLKALTLLSSRELNGKVIHVNKKKSNFEEEIYKTQGSTPPVWKYPSTENTGNAALKYMQIDIQTSRGLTRKNILVAGSTGGTLSVLGVARTFYGVRRLPHSFRPEVSSISSIQLIGRSDNFNPVNRALITTLRRTGRRSVFFLNLAEGRNTITTQSIQGSDDVPFECTIWTADCNISGSHAALGTDLGAALVDLETGAGSYFLRSESDVLALQFHQSGNIVQCGLRDGAIVSLDLRERPRLIRHQIRHHQSSSQAGQTTTNKQWFELQGHINPSQLIYMPSSLTCLKTLKPYDQYLMASSMDGTIRLYDQRMVNKGVAVQTYEGHVNSNFRIKFGVDPSERFLISGGTDCYTRIWSIKSGQLLSENKFSNTVPSVVCWSAVERQRDWNGSIVHGAWLGSNEAIMEVF